MIIAQTGFQHAITLKWNGVTRRLPSCEHHDDLAYEVGHDQGGFYLLHLDSRDNGFKELKREPIPPTTAITNGYHDDEHGRWQTVAQRLNAIRY